jgi:cytochrome P450
MHDRLRTLLAAGHETSASTLSWALYHIYRDHGVRERLVAELSGCATPVEMAALPYLNAVIRETLRMHPAVPIVLRRLAGSLIVDGVHCHEGYIVGLALYGLHFNPWIWSDADRFDPDRFIGKQMSPFEYAPFGGGHRRCIGAAFAGCELAISIGTIMKQLDLRMPKSEANRKPPRSVACGIAVSPNREIALDVMGVDVRRVTSGTHE